MEKTFLISAKTEKLDDIFSFVNEQLQQWGCPEKLIVPIDLAVEEVFVNIANYAYEDGAGEAEIRMKKEGDGDSVSITFKDSGVPYNPLEKEDPDLSLPLDERPIGGLGVFMVKNIADEVAYEYVDGQNTFTFWKSW